MQRQKQTRRTVRDTERQGVKTEAKGEGQRERDGHSRLEKYLPPPTLGPLGVPEAWKMGGGGAATTVEKGGRMSATPAENKQTTVPAPMAAGGSFPVLSWQRLRQGFCISKE